MSTESTVDILAKTLWGEARGEGYEGMLAVGWVVRNRAEKPCWWGKCIETVCRAPWQFSCWNENDPNFSYLQKNSIPTHEYELAHRAALDVIGGQVCDPTGGATHYYSTSMGTPPNWANNATETARIGRHIFFKDVP